MFKIEIFADRDGNSPILQFLDGLNKTAQTNKDSRIRLKIITRYFNALREYGTQVGMPFVRHIEGDLWELRPADDRFFFAYWTGKTFIILHHYVKKSQKTPLREIEQAKRNLKEFLER
ncbi:MAG: type II toxin-antitoxin system RelE/ParE family toxin [Firmicutes bacterium]|nr:type II toxin-antitoxin system RelE/ParE family toxin [Bacillota bacterium]